MLLLGYTSIGQVDLNGYKYIIIPKVLGEFKEQNQYLTSTLLKHEFVQRGFTAIYDDIVPADLYAENCLGLTAVLKDDSSAFRTKIRIVLEDCKGQEVYSSMEARNKIKKYREAYKEAIREAMLSFDTLNYSYSKKSVKADSITVSFKNDVKTLDSDQATQGINANDPERKKIIKQTSTLEDQSFKSMEPVASDYKRATPKKALEPTPGSESAKNLLYAQVIPNGYQLSDSNSKVKMKLLNSSTENVFIGQANDKSGMVFQKDGVWIFEYYSGGDLVQEELTIKF